MQTLTLTLIAVCFLVLVSVIYKELFTKSSWGADQASGDFATLAAKLFGDHGMEAEVEGFRVLPLGRLPAISAVWEPQAGMGQLTVLVELDGEKYIDEAFVGLGDGRAGFNDAVQNFIVNDFHVMFAALWGDNAHDRLEIEEWEIGGRNFVVYWGACGIRYFEDNPFDVPVDFGERVESAIRSLPSLEGLNWFRFFAGQFVGELTIESLWNNEIWPVGAESLRSVDWSQVDQEKWSVRLFLVVKEA